MLLIWPLQWDKPGMIYIYIYIDFIPQRPWKTKIVLWHHQSKIPSFLHIRLVWVCKPNLISHHGVHLLLRCVRRYENHLNRCHPCSSAISPCGRFIASGSEDNCVSCNTLFPYTACVCVHMQKVDGYCGILKASTRLNMYLIMCHCISVSCQLTEWWICC